MYAQIQFDAKDQSILDGIFAEREQVNTPRVGDFVRFPTGELERISHRWPDGFQTSPTRSGSYYLCSEGNASYSGGLNPSIPKESLLPIDELMDGQFWFFHHGCAGAHRGVYFSIPCRVYETTAPYQGFLS